MLFHIWTDRKFLLILIISLLRCLSLCCLHLSSVSVFLSPCFGEQLWRTCVHIIIPKATSSVVRVQCKQTHTIMEICESKQGWKMAETLTFLLCKIYILCFVFVFYLKLTLYYCEVLLISVKPIVNNKDIDEYCFTFGCSSSSKHLNQL